MRQTDINLRVLLTCSLHHQRRHRHQQQQQQTGRHSNLQYTTTLRAVGQQQPKSVWIINKKLSCHRERPRDAPLSLNIWLSCSRYLSRTWVCWYLATPQSTLWIASRGKSCTFIFVPTEYHQLRRIYNTNPTRRRRFDMENEVHCVRCHQLYDSLCRRGINLKLQRRLIHHQPASLTDRPGRAPCTKLSSVDLMIIGGQRSHAVRSTTW